MAGWFGLEALLNRNSSKKSFQADDLFNSDVFVRIPNIRCMPVGVWFNHIKPSFNISDYNLRYFTVDQLPVMYSIPAVIDAIKRLPKFFPAYQERLTTGNAGDDFWKEVPQFYVTNARLERFQDQHWLYVDLLCLQDFPPEEFQSLTYMRAKQLADYVKDGGNHRDGTPAPWPDYWGVSGMAVDFLPHGTGKAELTNNGLHIKYLEVINFLAIAASLCSNPVPLVYLWRGDHMFKELGCRAARTVVADAMDKEWNPIFQLPREHWEKFLKRA